MNETGMNIIREEMFADLRKLIMEWMVQMPAISVRLAPGVNAIVSVLEEHRKIIIETQEEMREEGYPI